MFKSGSTSEGDITKMKGKNVVKMLTFFTVLGIITFSGSHRKPNLPDLGTETVVVSKIGTYSTPQNCTYQRVA